MPSALSNFISFAWFPKNHDDASLTQCKWYNIKSQKSSCNTTDLIIGFAERDCSRWPTSYERSVEFGNENDTQKTSFGRRMNLEMVAARASAVAYVSAKPPLQSRDGRMSQRGISRNLAINNASGGNGGSLKSPPIFPGTMGDSQQGE